MVTAVTRIILWLMSTLTVLVLLFGYHTSTSSASAQDGRSSVVSPACTYASRVNFSAREMSLGVGTDVTTVATGVGSAKIGFLLEREADHGNDQRDPGTPGRTRSMRRGVSGRDGSLAAYPAG